MFPVVEVVESSNTARALTTKTVLYQQAYFLLGKCFFQKSKKRDEWLTILQNLKQETQIASNPFTNKIHWEDLMDAIQKIHAC